MTGPEHYREAEQLITTLVTRRKHPPWNRPVAMHKRSPKPRYTQCSRSLPQPE
jgi:hypothetical protein